MRARLSLHKKALFSFIAKLSYDETQLLIMLVVYPPSLGHWRSVARRGARFYRQGCHYRYIEMYLCR